MVERIGDVIGKECAVFGMGADVFPVGENYSGPFEVKWTAEDAKTPLQYLREYLDGFTEVIFAEGDVMDRSDIRLPGITRTVQKDDSAFVVGKFEFMSVG